MVGGDDADKTDGTTFLDTLILKQIDAVAKGLRTPHSREVAGTARELLLQGTRAAGRSDDEDEDG